MSESHQREAEIFDAAMELPPERRSGYLDEACGEDAALRRRVESLLKACESQCVFLDAPAGEIPGAGTAGLSVSEKPGETIGRYKLLEQIGEGGCGVVYVAEQAEPVRRRVALKIIKLGMNTRSVIARFEAERQALALMDHPNIAKVFDAGATDAGRPYFVMELVRGLKITEFCDEKKLCTRARLDLFIQVCQAIQHAHQKGIIHRDIKPSNILVTMNDGIAVPKVIDFGIAKATSGQQLTDKTLYTAFEQFIGTPAYMSPEQAVLTSLDIDTRSDIYALGVLLYELLTGKTPFDAKELFAIGLDEMRRTIREQEPPRPSTRLSTLPGQELSTTAHRRSLDAPKLVSELRGDLDWIVMKALEKDRARRYETANGLAADIQRHINNEPVVACPPSIVYRLQKAVRRNKLAFTAGSAVAASLLIGITLTTVLFFRERAAREKASEQAGIARAVNDFLHYDLLRLASHHYQAEAGITPDPNLTMRAAVDRAAERIGDRFKDRPLQEAAIRMSIWYCLSAVGEVERAIPHLQRALELRRRELGPDHPDTLSCMSSLASAYQAASNLGQVLPLAEETLNLRKARLGPDHPDTLTSMAILAVANGVVGKHDQALPLFEETLRLQQAKLGRDHPDTLRIMGHLAVAYRYVGRNDEALPLFEEALKLQQAKLRPDHPDTLFTMENLAKAYSKAGKPEQALPLAEETLKLVKRSLGPDHPATLDAMNSLANTYLDAGKLDKALLLYEETLRLQKARLRPDDPATLWTMHNLAVANGRAGKSDKALTLLEETVKLGKVRLGPDHPSTLQWMMGLGIAYFACDKFDQALPILKETLQLQQARLGPDHPQALLTMKELAWAYQGLRKFDQALTLYQERLNLRTAKLGPDHPDTLNAMAALASGYREAGKLDQAISLFEETLRLMKAKLGPDRSQTLVSMDQLVSAYLAARKFDPALALCEERLKLTKDRRGQDHSDTLRSINNLAWAYRKAGKLDQLEALYRQQIAQQSGDVLNAKIELSKLLLEAAKTNRTGSRRREELASEGEELLRGYLADVRSRYTNDPLKLAGKLNDVAELHYRQGNHAKAEPLYREMVQYRRAGLKPDDKYLLDATASLARLLSDWAWAERDSKSALRTPIAAITERAREADRLLREVLAVRLRENSDPWRIGDVKSRLGGALVSIAVTDPGLDAEGRQAKLGEAESLLLEGCERVQSGATDNKYKRDALQRLVRLYEVWNKPDKHAEWQQKLELFDKAQNESSGSNPLTEDSPNARTESK